MIVFDLRCPAGHVFEAWFQSSDDFESQQQRHLIECPVCASPEIVKAVMAPAVGPKGNQSDSPEREKARLRALAALQRQVEERCDYVGKRFVAEARRRHERSKGGERPEGERPESERSESERGIFGEASIADALELIDEGIAVAPLPFRPRQTADA